MIHNNNLKFVEGNIESMEKKVMKVRGSVAEGVGSFFDNSATERYLKVRTKCQPTQEDKAMVEDLISKLYEIHKTNKDELVFILINMMKRELQSWNLRQGMNKYVEKKEYNDFPRQPQEAEEEEEEDEEKEEKEEKEEFFSNLWRNLFH